MDKYFEYEEIENDKRVKIVVKILKDHDAVWWDNVLAEKRKKEKPLIKIWDRMVAKTKSNISSCQRITS